MKKISLKNIVSKISKLTLLQKIIIFGSTGLVLIAAILLIMLSISSKRPYVAFYNISDNVQKSIIKILNENQKSNNDNPFEVIVLDSTIPLSAQEKSLKKVDLIVASNDFDAQNFIKNYKKTKPLPSYFTQEMPSTTIQTLDIKNHTVMYVPILYDFYELDVNFKAFEESGTKKISIWSDLINFAQNSYNQKLVAAPLLITGSDDEKLINSFGMMVEALYGYEELESIEKEIYSAFRKDNSTTDNAVLKNTLAELAKGDTAFNNTGLTLIRLRNSEVLPKFYTNFVHQDFNFFINDYLTAAAFTTLSEHRTIASNKVGNYKSIYMPGIVENQERKFLAPQVVVASFNKGMNNSARVLCDLKQSELCSSTGLAPVKKNCSVPDVQADDVRYWLAASAGPILPLSASVPSEKAKKYLAQFIRDSYSF